MVINDVYWIAFIIYFGFIGLFIFMFLLYRLYKASMFVFNNSDRKKHQALALSVILILITSIPYAFIIRTFVFRHYSLYFWALAALIILEWHRLRINKNLINAK